MTPRAKQPAPDNPYGAPPAPVKVALPVLKSPFKVPSADMAPSVNKSPAKNRFSELIAVVRASADGEKSQSPAEDGAPSENGAPSEPPEGPAEDSDGDHDESEGPPDDSEAPQDNSEGPKGDQRSTLRSLLTEQMVFTTKAGRVCKRKWDVASAAEDPAPDQDWEPSGAEGKRKKVLIVNMVDYAQNAANMKPGQSSSGESGKKKKKKSDPEPLPEVEVEEEDDDERPPSPTVSYRMFDQTKVDDESMTGEREHNYDVSTDDDVERSDSVTAEHNYERPDIQTPSRRRRPPEGKPWIDFITGQFQLQSGYDPHLDFKIFLPGPNLNVIDLWIPVYRCFVEVESSNLKKACFIQIPEATSISPSTGRLLRLVGADKAKVCMPIDIPEMGYKAQIGKSLKNLPTLKAVNKRQSFRRVVHSDPTRNETVVRKNVCMEFTVPGDKTTNSVCLELPNHACLFMLKSRNMPKPLFVRVQRIEGKQYGKNIPLIQMNGVDEASMLISDYDDSRYLSQEIHADFIRLVTPNIPAFIRQGRGLTDIQVHLKKITAESHHCLICGKVFSTEQLRKEHDEKNKGKCAKPNVFYCRYCCNDWNDLKSLKTHLEAKHSHFTLYECQMCHTTRGEFASKKHVLEHLMKHDLTPNRKCLLCPQMKLEAGLMRIHLNQHAGLHIWECSTCHLKYPSRPGLKKHVEKHVSGILKCEQCSYECRRKDTLSRHVKMAHEGMVKTCDICTRSFATKAQQKFHTTMHKRGLVCDNCGAVFVSSEHLIEHREKVQSFQESCRKGMGKDDPKYRRKPRMGREEREVKEEEEKEAKRMRKQRRMIEEKEKREEHEEKAMKEMKCPCPMDFVSLEAIVAHAETCHPNDSFCKECGHFFSHVSALRRHEKAQHCKAVCRYCDIVFASSGDFQQHWRDVHKTKIHKCRHCGHVAESKRKLSRHRVEKHGVPSRKSKFCKVITTVEQDGTECKIYACTKCHANFVDETMLQSHVLRHEIDEMATSGLQDVEIAQYEAPPIAPINESPKKDILKDALQELQLPKPGELLADSPRSKRVKISEIHCHFIKVSSDHQQHYIEVSDDLKNAVGVSEDGTVDIHFLTKSLALDDGTLLQMSEATHRTLTTCQEVRSQDIDESAMLVIAVNPQEQAPEPSPPKPPAKEPPKKKTTKKSEMRLIDPRSACDICGKTFANETGIKTHKSMVHRSPYNSDQVPCLSTDCSLIFKCEEHRDLHVKAFHRSIVCEHCPLLFMCIEAWEEHDCEADRTAFPVPCGACENDDILFQDEDSMTDHVLEEHPNKSVCGQCGLYAEGKDFLQAHQDSVHGKVDKFKCPRCFFTTVKAASLREHLLRHISSQLWPARCDACHKRFLNEDQKNQHESRVHGDSESLLCEQCGRNFTSAEMLYKHIEMAHNRNMKEQCSRCRMILDSEKELDEHAEVCEGKLYKCDFCGQGFVENNDILSAHMASHVRERNGGKYGDKGRAQVQIKSGKTVEKSPKKSQKRKLDNTLTHMNTPLMNSPKRQNQTAVRQQATPSMEVQYPVVTGRNPLLIEEPLIQSSFQSLLSPQLPASDGTTIVVDSSMVSFPGLVSLLEQNGSIVVKTVPAKHS